MFEFIKCIIMCPMQAARTLNGHANRMYVNARVAFALLISVLDTNWISDLLTVNTIDLFRRIRWRRRHMKTIDEK